MKKITLTKDQKTIQVNEAAARILKKTGWIEATKEAEIIKRKTIEPPEEVKELIRSKKEDATVKEEPKITEPDVIAEPEIIKEKPKRSNKKK